MSAGAEFFEYVNGWDADSEHPHGDLDRIDIPDAPGASRSAASAAICGMDVCYLLEWALTRANSLTSFTWLASNGGTSPNNVTVYDPANFFRELTPKTFSWLAYAFNGVKRNLAFVEPYNAKTMDLRTASSSGTWRDALDEILPSYAIDLTGCKAAADFSGSHEPLKYADVNAYFAAKTVGLLRAGLYTASPGSPSYDGNNRNYYYQEYSGDRKMASPGAWGYAEWEYTGADDPGYGEECNYPQPGLVVARVVAPHAAKVYLASIFEIAVIFADSTSFGTFRAFRMDEMSAAGGGAFTITTSQLGIDSVSATQSIIAKTGCPWEWDESFANARFRGASIRHYGFPLVVYDDHIH